MSELTNKLGLYLPGGGSTGLIQPDEQVDIDKLNDNFRKIDAATGAVGITSTTHPASPYDGLIIQESDTNNTLIYSGALSKYLPVGVPNCRTDAERDGFYSSPAQGTQVNRTDKGYVEQYYTAYNATTNKLGAAPAGWYPAPGNGPRVVVARPQGQNLSNANILNFTAEYVNPNGMWDATAPTKLTAPVTGWYRAYGRAQQSGTIAADINIRVNAGTIIAKYQSIRDSRTGSSGAAASPSISGVIPLTAADYVEFLGSTNGAVATAFQILNFGLEYVSPIRGAVT